MILGPVWRPFTPFYGGGRWISLSCLTTSRPSPLKMQRPNFNSLLSLLVLSSVVMAAQRQKVSYTIDTLWNGEPIDHPGMLFCLFRMFYARNYYLSWVAWNWVQKIAFTCLLWVNKPQINYSISRNPWQVIISGPVYHDAKNHFYTDFSTLMQKLIFAASWISPVMYTICMIPLIAFVVNYT